MDGLRIKTALRYALRLVPILIVAGGLVWFFFLRSPGQADTPPQTADPETVRTDDETTKATESKTADNALKTAPPATTGTSTEENLPATGPSDSLAIFILATIAGILFWNWRLRRAGQS